MTEPAEGPSPAELAQRIAAADRPPKPYPGGLRFQWNVPRGIKPDVPLWFAVLVISLMAGVPLLLAILPSR